MQFLEQFGDDQVAIIGCIGALLFCGGFMAISQYIGRIPGSILSDRKSERNIEAFEAKDDSSDSNDRKLAA